jgi:hypothetical protein
MMRILAAHMGSSARSVTTLDPRGNDDACGYVLSYPRRLAVPMVDGRWLSPFGLPAVLVAEKR